MNYNTQEFQTAANFLEAIKDQKVISTSLRASIEEKNIILVPFEHYVRKDMSSGADKKAIIDFTTEIRHGLSTISKGKLNSNEAFILTELALGQGKGTKEAEVDYSTKVSPALRNAVVEIMQGGRNVLTIPASSLVNPYTGQSANDDFHKLRALAYLGDDKDFTASLIFPDGVTMPAVDGENKTFVEMRMRGFKTASRL